MARVAVLTHVKESTIADPPSVTRVGPRMPWSGGKLVTNKEEALRKFLARKPQTTATLTAEQIKILETTSTKMNSSDSSRSKKHHPHQSKHDVIHKITPTSKRMAHRAHVKVQGSSHTHKKTIVVNGRVVGPRVGGNVKANAARGPKPSVQKSVSKKGSGDSTSSRPSDTGIALQDKLGMSLDALVKRNGNK